MKAEPSPRAGYFRWIICALLLFGTTKNYMDRQVLGILKGPLQHDLGWNDIDFGNLVLAFRGPMRSACCWWAGSLTGWVHGWDTRCPWSSGAWLPWGMLWAAPSPALLSRGGLSFGESGVFPASIKTVAEWFPKKSGRWRPEYLNAGSNLGAIVTPLIVPWIAIHWGWRWAFLITGASGSVWLAFWLLLYRRPEQHPRVSQAELDYIRSDPQPPMAKIAWARLIPHRQTWAFVVGKLMTDPIWWFYLFWIPDFLNVNTGWH